VGRGRHRGQDPVEEGWKMGRGQRCPGSCSNREDRWSLKKRTKVSLEELQPIEDKVSITILKLKLK